MLNWVRRSSWGWWDESDDTALQKQGLEFKPWRSEAEHATSWSRKILIILMTLCFFEVLKLERRTNPRASAWQVTVFNRRPWHKSYNNENCMTFNHIYFQKKMSKMLLTPSSLNIPLSFNIPLNIPFIHYKPRIAVAILDLSWMKMIWREWKIEENCHVLVEEFHGNFHSKTLGCKKIKSVFRDVKWCLNTSWGLKGLINWPLCCWDRIYTQ